MHLNSTDRQREGTLVPTREGYDSWAELYDGEGNPLVAIEEPVFRELLGDVRGLDVVDLGCGTGRHSLWCGQQGARVTAVDFSAGMVSKAATKPGWEHVRFIEHDLTQPWPLPDASFDRVLSGLLLDHVQDLVAFFRECRRVCRPGGFVLHSTVHPAMTLRGIRAHYTDPATGRDVFPESADHSISIYVMASVRAGLTIRHIGEHAVDSALAAVNPRAAKYLDWPLLLVLQFAP